MPSDEVVCLEVLEVPNSCQVTVITYNPEGTELAVGCVSGEVYRYDIFHQEWSRFVVSRRHGNRVLHLHWDERGCFSIGWDGVMILWDPRNFKTALSSFVPCGNPEATIFNGKSLIIGTTERTNNLHLYDLSSNQAKLLKCQTVKSTQAALNLHANDTNCEVQLIHSCRFDPKLISIGTSHNNTVKLFSNTDTSKGLVELYSYENLPADYLLAMTSSSSMRRLFVGGKGYQGHIDIK